MNTAAATAVPSFARDIVALCKPRITLMVTATGVAGALAAKQPLRPSAWFAVVGTVLIVAGANAMNMWIERESDAQMERTRDRPLAAGRISPNVGLLFALTVSAIALPLLWLTNSLVAILGAVAWVFYVALYTPMKRFTMWALPVGAVAGAMPPAMGWAAATGALDIRGWYLFALLFFWQLPHFVAIAMVRGAEYSNAGLAVGSRLSRARKSLMISAVAFVAVTLLSPLGGNVTRIAAGVTGVAFLVLCARAAAPSSGRSAARDAFAFTMAHLAIVLVAIGIR